MRPGGTVQAGAGGTESTSHSEKVNSASPTVAWTSSRSCGMESHHAERFNVNAARQPRYTRLITRATMAMVRIRHLVDGDSGAGWSGLVSIGGRRRAELTDFVSACLTPT